MIPDSGPFLPPGVKADRRHNLQGDFAAGERRRPASTAKPDFARGQREQPASSAVPDFARGERQEAPNPVVGNFASGSKDPQEAPAYPAQGPDPWVDSDRR